MVSRWPQFPADVPADGQLIWARIDRWSGRPFLARFDEATLQVIATDNNLPYPFWAISAWREADPPPSIPAFPIDSVHNPNSSSSISNFGTINPSWRLRFNPVSIPGTPENFSMRLSLAYAAATTPDPAALPFRGGYVFNLGLYTGLNTWFFIGATGSGNVAMLAQNFLAPPLPSVVSGHRMFLKVEVIHRPTGYMYPPRFYSVQVT